jgi:beta-galactosidase
MTRLARLWLVLIQLLLIQTVFPEDLVAPGMLANLPGSWSLVGGTNIRAATDSTVITAGLAVEQPAWTDGEISFRARAPRETEQVQIWAGFHYRDRDSRYVFALRGGHDNDVYLARYAPDGKARFLGFAPLDFPPVPGTWYRLRVVVLGNRFHIYLNDEKLPRLNVEDHTALWSAGRAFLGGGWLPAEFADFKSAPLSAAARTEFLAVGDEQWTAPAIDKEALRQSQRAAYTPARVASLNPLRTEVSLDGHWLLLPDYELPAGQPPVTPDYDDHSWHVMTVPSFWTPGLSWLHGEIGFPELDGVSQTKGVAESLYVQETRRCDGYTFDWRKTSAAWYRHYVELPAKLNDRRFELSFGAIAKISEIWVNGIKVGTHTGMFGEVRCDITRAVRPGQNVIAVHVIGRPQAGHELTNQVEGVAVTVEVTSAMLHSLAHGMFQNDVGGIWQPVKLTATAPVWVSDAFIQPGLHGADISVDIQNTRAEPAALTVDYTITAAADGTTLYASHPATPFVAAAGETGHLKLVTPYLDPKLWSPQEPNLYNLEIRLTEQGHTVDSYQVPFGFRTFTQEGATFQLNGRPFWLRGADPFPNTLRPNDAELARRFMEIAHAGNVSVTRSHIVPFTPTWLDAADKAGVAVSFEGTWPWLMLRGQPPDDDLVQAWRQEYISLIHQYRNHPSIILWTVNNEMKFEQGDQGDPVLLKKKWTILNETIREMRVADPTRPIVADSSYVRKEASKGYRSLVQPAGLDDGDADDVHRYFGWYNDSFFHLYDGQFNKLSTPGRPLISQEMSTGYPNNDDGHPVRFYLFKHYTPQALVGDDAYENADPAIFLTRQAFMTKELAETLRRTSHHGAAGVLYFSYFTWFQTPWSADRIKPWPGYYALKNALQPLLVSAELYGRHFYAGDTVHRRVCVINDADNGEALPASRLTWEFTANGQILGSGQLPVPPVNYYDNRWLDVDFTVPTQLPQPRVDGQLVLRLEAAGKVLSENSYDVMLATTDWTKADGNDLSAITLWDPGEHSAAITAGLPVTTVNSLADANPTNVLLVGSLAGLHLTPVEMASLREFVSGGGHVLMLHPGANLARLFPDQVRGFKAKAGEIVTMHIPESPVFSGIKPLDLAWFETPGRQTPIACTGVYRIPSIHPDSTELAWQCDIHGYLNDKLDINTISGTPLLEIRAGAGRLLASELALEAGQTDPVARRLMVNAIQSLQSQ